MKLNKFQKFKETIASHYQALVPVALVSSLLLVGYAAIDKEAPVISTESVTITYGGQLDIETIQIEDNQSKRENLVIDLDLSTLNTNKVGKTHISVQATDESNNTVTKEIEVNVVDTEMPVYLIAENENCIVENGVLVINLNGSNVITEYINAVDNADGDVTAYINQSAPLDTSRVQKSAIGLSVSDSSGNENNQQYDIEIRDISAPVMEYKFAPQIEVPYGEEVDVSKYFNVTDNSGKIAVLAPTAPIDPKLAEADYTIVAEDEAGNAVSLPLKIFTRDIGAPTIQIDSSYEITVGDSFDINSKLTVTDNKDENITATIEGTVDPSKAGTYKVTITAKDEAGNESSKEVTVKVKAPAPKPQAAAPSVNAGSIVGVAKTKLGCAYVSGGTGPSAFDCSGFTQWVFRQCGKSIGRTTYAQYAAGTKVSYSQMQPGDLIFWNCYGTNSHVGIYVGGGMMIHAATERLGVCYTSIANMSSQYSIYGIARY